MECSVHMWSAVRLYEAGGRLFYEGDVVWQAKRYKLFFLTSAIAAPSSLSPSNYMCKTNIHYII